MTLYIAEGYKRSRNSLALGNSDPAAVMLANWWFGRLSTHERGYGIQYHADQDPDALRAFWGRTLDIDGSTIHLVRKSNSGQLAGRRWRSRHGVLTVRVHDTLLRARLQAWIDSLQDQWLISASTRGVAQPGGALGLGAQRPPVQIRPPRCSPVQYRARMAATDAPRWATFDCYGTLVDWNAGIGGQLGRLFGADAQERLLARYHELEPRVQRARPDARYRDVMATVLAEIADDEGTELPDDERDALGRSLPDWPVFPEVPAALPEAHDRGWRLVALTNSDRDLIEASMQAIGVPFDGAVVASEIGSYKPQHGHWRVFYETYGADPARHVHVAQSHFHDVVPAGELGIPSVWINRLGEDAHPPPTRERGDLNGLADVLDELVA